MYPNARLLATMTTTRATRVVLALARIRLWQRWQLVGSDGDEISGDAGDAGSDVHPGSAGTGVENGDGAGSYPWAVVANLLRCARATQNSGTVGPDFRAACRVESTPVGTREVVAASVDTAEFVDGTAAAIEADAGAISSRTGTMISPCLSSSKGP